MEILYLLILVIPLGILIGLILGVTAFFRTGGDREQILGLKLKLSEYYERIQKLERRLAELESRADGVRADAADESSPVTGSVASAVSVPPYVLQPMEEPEAEAGPGLRRPVEPPPLATPPEPAQASAGPSVAEGGAEGASTPPVREERAESFPWRDVLEQFHLLPPKADRTEANLAAWWTTRVGIVLAVITAVFFAVYISQGTPAWVKLAELAGGSLLVTALGYWLGFWRKGPDERQAKVDLSRYGEVVFSGGLAMIYLTAYAAYSFEPVKVIDSPQWAALLQFGAALLVMAAAVWVNRMGVAVLSAILGYLACWFGQFYGLNWFVPVCIGALGVIYSVLLVWRGWFPPVLIALAGTFGTYGTTVLDTSESVIGPSLSLFTAFLGLYFVTFVLADALAERAGVWGQSATWRRRVFISGTSSLSFLCAFLYFQETEPAELEWLYLSFGILFGGLAFTFYRMAARPYGFHNYFLKGTGLLAIGLVYWLEGPAQWFSLLIQAGSVVYLAGKTRSALLEVFAYIVLVVAWGVFLNDLSGEGTGRELPLYGFVSTDHAWRALFFLGLTGVLTFLGRVLAPIDSEVRNNLRQPLWGLFALGLVGTALWMAEAFRTEHFSRMIGLCGYGVAGLAVGLVFRHWIAGVAGGSIIALTTILYWLEGGNRIFGWEHFWIGLVLTAVASQLPLLFRMAVKRWGINVGDGLDGYWQCLAVAAPILTWTRAVHSGSEGLDRNDPFLWVLGGLFVISCGAGLWYLNRTVKEDAAAPGGLRLTDGVGILAGLCVSALGITLFESNLTMIGLSIAALGLGSASYGSRLRSLFMAAVIPLLTAAVLFIFYDGVAYLEWVPLYHGAAGLLGLTLVLFAEGTRRRLPEGVRRLFLDFVYWGALLLGLLVMVFQTLPVAWCLVLAFLLPLLLWLARLGERYRGLGDLQWMLTGLALVAVLPVSLISSRGLDDSALYVGGLAGLFLLIGNGVCGGWGERFRPVTRTIWSATALNAWMATVLAAFGLVWAYQCFDSRVTLLVLTGFLWALAFLARGAACWGHRLWFYGIAVVLVIHSLVICNDAGKEDAVLLLISVATACASMMGGAILFNPLRSLEGSVPTSIHHWVVGALGLGCLFVVFLHPGFELIEWTTVFWGLSSIFLFGAGFFFKLRPYRILGLIGLAICIPRVFIVDIDDAFYRIIAFGILAVVLLGVGFLYSKFRHRIEL